MSSGHRHVLLCWIALLLLAAAELGGSFVHIGGLARDVLLIPGLVMVSLVALVFMRLSHGTYLARSFALAGLLWLLLFLGLGTMDPMTRAVYPVGACQFAEKCPVSGYSDR